MASLSIDQSEIVLRGPMLEFRIPREKILKTSIKNRILYKGIVIEHTADDVPEIMVFWTRDAEEIVSQLSVASSDIVVKAVEKPQGD